MSEKKTKGQALIVAEKNKDGKFYTDGVIVYDSYCLSKDKPQVLQFGGSLTDDIIYITGHGKKKNQTISGYSMDKIADMLISSGYNGKQEIKIVSCYSKHKDENGKDMADLLKDELEKKLIIAEAKNILNNYEADINDSVKEVLETSSSTVAEIIEALHKSKDTISGLLDTVINKLKDEIKVEALAEHTTIIVESFGECYVSDIHYWSWVFSGVQRKVYKNTDTDKILLDSAYSTKLDKIHNKNKLAIAKHNYSLLDGKGNKVAISETLFVLAIIFGAISILFQTLAATDKFDCGLCLFAVSLVLFIIAAILLVVFLYISGTGAQLWDICKEIFKLFNTSISKN